MNEKEIKDLLDKYNSGAATDEEKALLESWYLDFEMPGDSELGMNERIAAVDKVWANLNESETPVKRLRLWPRIAAAALLLFILSVGSYLLLRRNNNSAVDPTHLANTKKDIAPGTNKATLTLGNGKVIFLSNGKTGINVMASALIYSDGSKVDTAAKNGSTTHSDIQMATLRTPEGGTYQVSLPDGSKIWLNAASSISFPSTFARLAERKVELTGEAYFEVAKNKTLPFRVVSAGQVVEVLGTHFNINTYTDEPATKTTLLEGSVKVAGLVLKPGEQAFRKGTEAQIITANIDDVMGWKNNYVVFEDEKIESVMRKIARWYNVEVIYEGEHPTDNFGGRVSRFAYVSQVLEKLELTNKVHFKVAGRRIIVTK